MNNTTLRCVWKISRKILDTIKPTYTEWNLS